MLKKFLVLFGMVAAFVGNAGAAKSDPTNPNAGGDPNPEPGNCGELSKDGDYYLIGNADDLDAFACIVNRSTNAFTGKAKLTADIHYLGNDRLLNDERTGLKKDEEGDIIPAKQWTPLKNFAGTFDGQGHTIYGLYAVSASSDVGFISDTPENAVVSINDLHIADSYFYVDGNHGAGGLIGKSNGKMNAKNTSITLTKCSFSGFIGSSDPNNANNGGLIGCTGDNVALTMKNSYNTGNINPGAGLVGTMPKGSKVNADNCYNVGGYTTNPLMGGKGTQGNITITGKNLGCIAANNDISVCNANFNSAGNTFVSNDIDAVVTNYWANYYGTQTPPSQDDPATPTKSLAEQLMDEYSTACPEQVNCLEGIKIESREKVVDVIVQNCTGLDNCSCDASNVCIEKRTIEYPVVILLNDDIEKLKMPKDLDAYGVEYGRSFSEGSSSICGGSFNVSTMVLPFTKRTDDIQGGKFYRPDRLYHETGEEYWTIAISEVTGNVEAHTPYIVCPTASQLTFIGSVSVLNADGNPTTEPKIVKFDRSPAEPDGAKWEFKGLYEAREFRYDPTDSQYDESDPERDRVYAFSGGKFYHIVAGKSPILRAYLLAPVGSDPSTAKSQMPGLMRAPSANPSEEARPSEIHIKIVGTDRVPFARLDPKDVPSFVVDSDSSENVGSEEPQEIKKPLIFPVRRDNNASWYDMKGRSMNRKPSAKGVYLNNNIPVMVK